MTTLEKTLRWIVLAGVFALPFVSLLVTTSLFFPYITGKNFAFRIIVEVITGAWLALALVNPIYRPRRSWVLAALALFVFIIAIADAQGVNAFKSFWSNFERMDGWVTIAHLLAYTFVAASIMNTEKLWRRLFQTSLAISLYLSGYGFLQIFGLSTLGGGSGGGLSTRIDATFGNPIYLAVYMLFHVFIAAMLLAQEWVEKGRGNRTWISLGYGAVIVFDTLALLFTGTRGTTIGLVAGGFVTAFLLVVLARNSRNVWRAAVGSIVGILILGGSFWLVRDAAWVQKIGFLNRIATISTSDSTVKSRFINWSIAWNGVQERPVLGWGQENYAIVFDKYYDSRMYAQEQWFDRVHNIIFDWLVAGGFLGLLSYLSIFVAALWVLWRKGFTIAERSVLTGLLAGYFVHNFFVFDNVTSYILFGTLLGYIAWRGAVATDSAVLPAGLRMSRSALPYAALVAAIAVWGVAWFVNASALAQNRALLSAVAPQSAGVLENLKYFEQAISYASYGTQEAREQLSQGAVQIGQSSAVPVEAKQKFFDAAVSELKKQAEAASLDARFPLYLGVLYDAYGNYAEGARVLQKALELSPQKQTIYYEIGQNAFARGDNAAALRAFKTAYELQTENTDAQLMYAAIAIRTGQDALADQLLKPLMESGDAADARVLAAYVARGQYVKAIPVWQAKIAAKPTDTQSYFTLAALYFQTGNNPKAIEVLQAAKKADSSVASQADSVIQQIQNGTAKIQ